ncbi:MAG: division plane positioning ATPase MipZ [Anaerolineae bacterium]
MRAFWAMEEVVEEVDSLPSPPDEKTIFIPEKKVQQVVTSIKGMVVAVMGVRSGAGATLTAINLAATIARQGRDTTLVDLDMIQGHIALYLNQRVKGSVDTLADLPQENIPVWLPQQVVPVSKHLQLLLAHPNQDGRFSNLSSYQANAILDTLTKAGQTVVLDIGHALTETTRPVLERADQVVAVRSGCGCSFARAGVVGGRQAPAPHLVGNHPALG